MNEFEDHVEWSNLWPDGIVIGTNTEERVRMVERNQGLPVVTRTVSAWKVEK